MSNANLKGKRMTFSFQDGLCGGNKGEIMPESLNRPLRRTNNNRDTPAIELVDLIYPLVENEGGPANEEEDDEEPL